MHRHLAAVTAVLSLSATAAEPVCDFSDPALLTLEVETVEDRQLAWTAPQTSRCGDVVTSDDGQVRLWGTQEWQGYDEARYVRGRRVVQWRDAKGEVKSRVAPPELYLDSQVDQIAALPGAPGRYLFLGLRWQLLPETRWAQVIELGETVRRVPGTFGPGTDLLLLRAQWPEGATKLRHAPFANGLLRFLPESGQLRFVQLGDRVAVQHGLIAVLRKGVFSTVKKLPTGLSTVRSWSSTPDTGRMPRSVPRYAVTVAGNGVYRPQEWPEVARTAKALVTSTGGKYCTGEVALNPPALDRSAPPDLPLVVWPLERVFAACKDGKGGTVLSEPQLVCADGSVPPTPLAQRWPLDVKCAAEGDFADEIRPMAGSSDNWWSQNPVHAGTPFTLRWSDLVFPRPWRIVGTLYDEKGKRVQELEEPDGVVEKPGRYELEPVMHFFDGEVVGRRSWVQVEPKPPPLE